MSAAVVSDTKTETLQELALENAALNADVYHNASVKHSVSQYVDGKIHTNGIESFWAMLKRGHKRQHVPQDEQQVLEAAGRLMNL